MVDPNIKKSVFDITSFPEINSDIEGYAIRYRITSEDKSRVSHWSPTIIVKPEYTHNVGNIVVSKQSSHVNVIWDAVNIYKGSNFIRKAYDYDIWIRWGNNQYPGDWIYSERLTGTSVSFIIPTTFTYNGVTYNNPNLFSIEVYLKGSPVKRANGIPGQPGTLFLKVYQALDQ